MTATPPTPSDPNEPRRAGSICVAGRIYDRGSIQQNNFEVGDGIMKADSEGRIAVLDMPGSAAVAAGSVEAPSPVFHTAQASHAAPVPHLRPLFATLIAQEPPRKGSGREDWYLYDVIYEGEVIVAGSRVPEFDACRVLLARGIAGKLVTLDEAGKQCLTLDIEKAARLTVEENRRNGPRFVKWKPLPDISKNIIRKEIEK